MNLCTPTQFFYVPSDPFAKAPTQLRPTEDKNKVETWSLELRDIKMINLFSSKAWSSPQKICHGLSIKYVHRIYLFLRSRSYSLSQQFIDIYTLQSIESHQDLLKSILFVQLKTSSLCTVSATMHLSKLYSSKWHLFSCFANMSDFSATAGNLLSNPASRPYYIAFRTHLTSPQWPHSLTPIWIVPSLLCQLQKARVRRKDNQFYHEARCLRRLGRFLDRSYHS